MAFFFGQNKNIWLCHSLDNYISKGNSQPDFLISLPCKCHLNFRELRSIVMFYQCDISALCIVCLLLMCPCINTNHHHVSIVRHVRLDNDNSSNNGTTTTTTDSTTATASGLKTQMCLEPQVSYAQNTCMEPLEQEQQLRQH